MPAEHEHTPIPIPGYPGAEYGDCETCGEPIKRTPEGRWAVDIAAQVIHKVFNGMRILLPKENM